MGANMARRLKETGETITAVYDINHDAAKALAEELDCAAPETLVEVALAADVIITVVTNDAAMRAIYGLDGGADHLLNEGGSPTGTLYVNCATISPEVHVEIERAARAVGALSLEACMASSITQAREGTLYLMTGGEDDAAERARPLLEKMSTSMRHIGPIGSAAKVKALVNMVMNINTAALAEGLGLGSALGLDLDMLREVFSQTGANSRVLETDGEDMQKRDHECYFSAEHAAKDTGIALDLAEEVGLSLRLAAATKAQYDEMIRRGLGDLDKSGVAELTFPGRG